MKKIKIIFLGLVTRILKVVVKVGKQAEQLAPKVAIKQRIAKNLKNGAVILFDTYFDDWGIVKEYDPRLGKFKVEYHEGDGDSTKIIDFSVDRLSHEFLIFYGDEHMDHDEQGMAFRFSTEEKGIGEELYIRS